MNATSSQLVAESPSQHYENFPVASWLCPAHLRAPIAAIYWFARTADDLADEGTASSPQRLADLAAFESDLDCVAQKRATSARWLGVFTPLARAIDDFSLPINELRALLSAFTQDVAYTAAARWYETDDDLLDYCSRSANPVGRLMLHLYGVASPLAVANSDAVCTALQLINFWQDLSVDLPRGRFYLSEAACAKAGVSKAMLLAQESNQFTVNLIATKHRECWTMMQKGSPIVAQVPGRAGWELRMVVQGGLAILRKIEINGYSTLTTRVSLSKWDVPGMLVRAIAMRPSQVQPLLHNQT